MNAHQDTCDGGVALTLAQVRSRFWIIHGKRHQGKRFPYGRGKIARFENKLYKSL